MSECRNKSLQTMFMMIGAAEKAGSGVDKIRKGWTSQHWRTPLVDEQMRPDRVYWQLPMVSLIPSESLTRLQDCFGTKFQNFAPPEIQALVTADLEGSVDNARMRQVTGNHATDVTRVLQGLVAKGALVQERQGRWSRYRLPIVGYSIHNRVDSIHSGVDSIHNSVSKDALLVEIARSARENRRIAPKEMERIIQMLCDGRWLSRRELSELLCRHIDGLRSRFLVSMVEHGLLRLRYPDKPNRVDQAYTSTKT